jgi:GTP-binding protein HflX
MILSDTVGFVSDLPTELVAAFRATLEEVLSADVILHVRDISHDATQEQAHDVILILETLGIDEKIPMFEIWNKTDLLNKEDQEFLENHAQRNDNAYLLSAISGKGMDTIVDAVEEHLTSGSFQDTLSLSHEDGKKRAWLYEQGVVSQEEIVETGIDFVLFWSARQKAQFASI